MSTKTGLKIKKKRLNDENEHELVISGVIKTKSKTSWWHLTLVFSGFMAINSWWTSDIMISLENVSHTEFHKSIYSHLTELWPQGGFFGANCLHELCVIAAADSVDKQAKSMGQTTTTKTSR